MSALVREMSGAPLALVFGLVVAAVVVWVGGVATQRWLETRGLEDRVSLEMIPSRRFDPSVDEVRRVADQLSRVRPAVHQGVPRSAAAVRVRLTSAGEGRVGMNLEGPKRAESVLRQAAYGEVQIRRVEPDNTTSSEPRATRRQSDDGLGL